MKSTESRTDDGLIAIRQTFTISKNATRVIIRMEITNCHKERSVDLTDFLVKRYADIDVDTGGSAGWAGFLAYWDKTCYSVFSYNFDGDAPKGKRAHVVDMVAMPSDLALDEPFIGQLGSQQYNQRANINPVVPGTRSRCWMEFCSGTPIDFWRRDAPHKHVLRCLPVICEVRHEQAPAALDARPGPSMT